MPATVGRRARDRRATASAGVPMQRQEVEMKTIHRVVVLAAFLILPGCGDRVVEKKFASEADLTKALGQCDVLGRIDVVYPCKVVRREDSNEALRFVHDGTPHFYAPSSDSTLSACFVEHEGHEGVVVVRLPRAAAPAR
jgi:hypothetical protein